MREEIQAGYELNISRVRKLVDVYRGLAGPGPGRRAVETTDVLRAAVVFLHATLEDVLRTLLTFRWAAAAPSHFQDVSILMGNEKRDKVTLVELASLRGKSIDELVQESVEAHLARSNFNNVGDVKTAISRSGLTTLAVLPYASSLAAMMTRRHQIVHRADRREVGGSGNHAAASLGVATVEAWIAAVEAIVAQL